VGGNKRTVLRSEHIIM